jgi:hypothetical protein
LWLPAVLLFGFCLCYALPFHAQTPHDIKVAVAGSVNASQISAGLQQGTIGPFTPLTTSVSAGASSVTVPANAAAPYRPGQVVTLYGGQGTSEQGQSQSLTISSVTPGNGSGGGDLITFTGTINSAYTQISGTGSSNGFVNFFDTGAYISPSAGLQQQGSGAFDIIPVQDDRAARQEVYDQAAQGAYVVNGGQATLYTAGADGQSVQWALIRAFSLVSHQQNLNQTTIDLVPAVPGDPTTTGLGFLSYAWNIVPLVLGLTLARARSLGRSARLGVVVGAGAFASIVGFLIGYGLGIVPNQALAILFAFLNFEAVALVTYGLLRFAGRYTIGLAIILFLFLSLPSSGALVPYQMVPAFFGWLHPIMPLGNLIDAMRSIFYFNGTNMTRPTLALLAWIAVGAILITASALVPGAEQRQAPGAGPNPEAAGGDGDRAVRELPGPAATTVEPYAIGSPTGQPTPSGNGTDGLGPHTGQYLRPGNDTAGLESPTGQPTPSGNGGARFGTRPPMLFGKVTDAAGAPLPAANITIIDAGGHQMLRTTTERHGRYAADGLPEGLLTVLVSLAGRIPVATRVMLAGDLPARQDFVIPDTTQGIASWPGLRPSCPLRGRVKPQMAGYRHSRKGADSACLHSMSVADHTDDVRVVTCEGEVGHPSRTRKRSPVQVQYGPPLPSLRHEALHPLACAKLGRAYDDLRPASS